MARKPTTKAPAQHRASWSKQDVAMLKKMAKRRPVGIIASELGRTEAAVRNKVRTLGLSMKPPERSPYGRP
jgi:predicted transcriptional regulator